MADKSYPLSSVLIVEDDFESQNIASALLKHHHVEVDTASHVNQAQELMALHTYDAIIIDLTLPEIDGWQFLHSLQQDDRFAHIPCIAVTAYHSAAVAQQALASGFTAYFSKPLDVYSFYDSMLQALKPT